MADNGPKPEIMGQGHHDPEHGHWDLEEEEFEKQSAGCCGQGGCCRQAPLREIKLKGGEVVRVNVLFYRSGCCFPHPGLSKDDLKHVPPALAQKGLEEKVWLEWVGKLRQVNSGVTPYFWGVMGWIMIFVLCFWNCLPCIACRRGAAEDKAWDVRMRAWQADFNKVLHPLGIYVKSQSRCDIAYAHEHHGGSSSTRKERHTERWLAFAVTPASIHRLQAEPHLIGDVEDTSCCGGTNEGELCMHP